MEVKVKIANENIIQVFTKEDEHFFTLPHEIENLTGIDFFYNLPDSIEDIIETDYTISDWTIK